jgi:hypothetical protein
MNLIVAREIDEKRRVLPNGQKRQSIVSDVLLRLSSVSIEFHSISCARTTDTIEPDADRRTSLT